MHKLRVPLALAALSVALVLACEKKGPCDDVTCAEGQLCDPKDGQCKTVVAVAPDAASIPDDAGTGSPADAATIGCNPACTGGTPFCDTKSRTCKACTETHGCDGRAPVCDPAGGNGVGSCVICTKTAGCDGTTPVCDTSVTGGHCIACRDDNDCGRGTCDTTTGACIAPDGGTADAATVKPDAAIPADAGIDDDGGVGACNLHPPAVSHGSCGTECARGFTCVAGQCVLNGGGGPVQVTLRFDKPEDLDLHLYEPAPDGGTCEIYYEDPNDMLTGPSSCGAVGSLDLDSNAGCGIDNVDTENIIYPSGAPAPSGTYTVCVDYYQNCSARSAVPYEIIVRNNGVTTSYCGSFMPSDEDSGGAGCGNGTGKVVTTFTVP